ncbi:transmembrane sensor [Catalinimonas alkaloidigena]|uniref:FecR family protein n=1 Tax=Catalinimonas alkaloidigena TaxID=1075417 RepID=UPI002405487B|nr:FecR domain-containing protein [Catalinimonas alkaloidigena]MDF9798733.1 transmembrane sensor [Catalinimonas alkaloidigena]
MEQQKFWRQLFARYVKGQSQATETKVLDQFFDEQQSDSGEVWNELKDSPEQVRQRILKNVQRGIRPSASKNSMSSALIGKAAASLLLLLGFSYFFYFKGDATSTKPSVAKLAWQTYSTQAGEQRKVMLPDSSTVQLNYLSMIRFEKNLFGTEERKVYLEGEAFFEVRRNEQTPFIVETESLSTRVLGTSFNVNVHDSEAMVAVASGLVEVSTNKHGQQEKIRLKPHEGALLDQQHAQLNHISHIPEEVFSWKEGVLAFKTLNMAQVIVRLERAYGVRIHCEASLLDRSVTASYQDQPISYVLDDLCFLLGAEYEINANQNISITPQ